MIKHLSWQNPCALALGVVLLGGCASLGGSPDRAAQAYQAEDWAAAEQGYAAYLNRRPEDAQAWFRLGNARAQRGKLEAAMDAYDRALALAPDDSRARHNRGLARLQAGVVDLLEARRGLPRSDAEAARTMRYLACLMETFMGHPVPRTCHPVEEPARGAAPRG
ncbi:tetratricopeptide repeat protein [Alkalilimnicola sp. S0819]|uniref:tetratricopeptide repeat protein n=1 Tax=Alkalilimnicola sp. S0819 TaxID=2613922 RepID=UPI0012614808|nr:tetratricopeptide repeat protein [Alkalilimnicola sp. S0819]KAB7619582.1 tetratricopeptide repeat protein [Alkalilimnicola sp. S0819]MPQ17635.1 tetratricopeptide repeat protein [Alkalilimnicola sp. S0819]